MYIEARAYLGQGANVNQNICVGTRSLVEMGAVVVKDGKASECMCIMAKICSMIRVISYTIYGVS